MDRYFKKVFFTAVGSSDRVRIYRHEVTKIPARIPFFETKRVLHRPGALTERSAKALLDELNGGPLPTTLTYADKEDPMEDLLHEVDELTWAR
jgi:hypothetical protein